MCVNKAGKKRHFTFSGPAMGPESRSQSLQRMVAHSKSKPLCESLKSIYKLPNNPKNYHSGLVKW